MTYDGELLWNGTRVLPVCRIHCCILPAFIVLTLPEEDRLSDSHRVGMAAPRPIKGILKNKNSASNVKPLPEDVQPENLDKAPGLSEDDQQ